MSRGTRTRIAEGVYRDARGLAATVKVRGAQRERRFASGTALGTIQDWRHRERARMQDKLPPATRGTFAHDVERYLQTLADRSALRKERAYQLDWWLTRFGRMSRTDLHPPMLRAALAELHTTKAASTCNHYRVALSHLWSTLDGKNAANPLRDVPILEEPEAEARHLPHDLVELIMGALAPWGRAVKGHKRSTVSLAAVRLRVTFTTGLSPAEIMRIAPGDLRLDDRAVYVRRRRKGKGAEGMMYPLTPDGVTALTTFSRANAFGPFSTHAVYKCWVKACKRLLKRTDLPIAQRTILEEARPYDLRHTFGTSLLQKTGNLKTTQELMRHRSAKTTKRYVRGAVADHLRAVIDQAFAGTGQPPTS